MMRIFGKMLFCWMLGISALLTVPSSSFATSALAPGAWKSSNGRVTFSVTSSGTITGLKFDTSTDMSCSDSYGIPSSRTSSDLIAISDGDIIMTATGFTATGRYYDKSAYGTSDDSITVSATVSSPNEISGTTKTTATFKYGYVSYAISCSGASSGSWTATATTPIATKTYIDNDNGSVTDSVTGLTWMRCPMGQTWTGSTCTGTSSSYTWAQAMALAGAVTFAGYSDWRIPSYDELKSIVDTSQFPTIDSIAFPGKSSVVSWTSWLIAMIRPALTSCFLQMVAA